MIVYDLVCSLGHRFESWFQSSAAFERQQEEHAVACPICGDSAVHRAPMAPRVGRGSGARGVVPDVELARDGDAPAAAPSVPAELRDALRRLRAHLEANCEYVGPSFPEEARRIHYGDGPPREIYGEASAEEAADLNEEGVRVQPIPWLPKRDG